MDNGACKSLGTTRLPKKVLVSKNAFRDRLIRLVINHEEGNVIRTSSPILAFERAIEDELRLVIKI